MSFKPPGTFWKGKWSSVFFFSGAVLLFLSGFEAVTGHTIPTRHHPEIRSVGANEALYTFVAAGVAFGIGCFFKGSEPDDPPPQTGGGPGADGLHEPED
jgi:hypothetical protein